MALRAVLMQLTFEIHLVVLKTNLKYVIAMLLYTNKLLSVGDLRCVKQLSI